MIQVDDNIAALLDALNNPALPRIHLLLDRVGGLLAALGNPQDRLPPTIHVAGTNGKGSTIAFMRAMLEAAGKRVHVYSSPHLVRFNERIVLAGREIDDAALYGYLVRARDAATNAVTFFEATTAAAFLAFAEHPADVLLLEVGMGGRLDATNLVRAPIATVITPVGLDHQEFLGDTLAAIAAEKAGIIKHGVPIITAVQEPEAMDVIARIAAEQAAPLTVATIPKGLELGLEGAHQRQNAALAIATLQAAMPVSQSAVAQGLKQARWPARLQRITRGELAESLGPFWLDGGHNAHAARALAAWLRTQPAPRVLICGLMARKDAAAFFAPLGGAVEHVICTAIPGAEDTQDPEILHAAARNAGLEAALADDLASAAALAQRYNPATVLVAGSLYLAGEILKTHE